MIRSRLSFARLFENCDAAAAACAYFIAVKVRFGFNFLFSRTPPAGLPSYWSILLLTTIVWAIAAEESGLWNVEQLYAPAGKPTAAGSFGVYLRGGDGAGFLYRQASYSRLVIGVSAAALFVLATTTRVIFRVFLELLRKDGKNEVKILVVERSFRPARRHFAVAW